MRICPYYFKKFTESTLMYQAYNLKIKKYIIPDKTLTAMVLSISHFKIKYTNAASIAIIKEPKSRVFQSGTNNLIPEKCCSLTVLKKVCMANHIPRFKITPTTAAVIPVRAEVKFLFPLKYSIKQRSRVQEPLLV